MVSREGNGGSGFERRREGRNTGAEQCDHSIAGQWFPSSLETRLNYSSHLKRYTRSLLSRAKCMTLSTYTLQLQHRRQRSPVFYHWSDSRHAASGPKSAETGAGHRWKSPLQRPTWCGAPECAAAASPTDPTSAAYSRKSRRHRGGHLRTAPP